MSGTPGAAGLLRRVAARVRHAPGLSALAPLWALVRPAYQRVLAASAGEAGVPVTVGGEQLQLDVAFASISWESIEPESYAAFRTHCTPGGVVFDIGAHLGTYAIIGARAVGASGRVVAFEPVPGTRAALARHLTLNDVTDRVTVRPVAVGADEGQTTLFVTADVGDAEASPVARAGARPVHVARTTVDLEAARLGRRVTLLKIDVEGQELGVLRGAARVLTHERPVVLVSAHPAALAAGGHDVATVRALLEDHGYVVRTLAEDHEVHLLALPGGAA